MKPVPDPIQDFVDQLQTSLQGASLRHAVLAKYHGDEAGLQRVTLRRVRLRDEPHLQVVYRYATRDITHNIGLARVPRQCAACSASPAFAEATCTPAAATPN